MTIEPSSSSGVGSRVVDSAFSSTPFARASRIRTFSSPNFELSTSSEQAGRRVCDRRRTSSSGRKNGLPQASNAYQPRRALREVPRRGLV